MTVSVIASRVREPDQVIQPWQFGHGETKATCLWQRIHMMPPGPQRWRERSRTYPGIAEAMADQWGRDLPLQLELTA